MEFMKFIIGDLYEVLSHLNFVYNETSVTNTLHGDLHAFLCTSPVYQYPEWKMFQREVVEVM